MFTKRGKRIGAVGLAIAIMMFTGSAYAQFDLRVMKKGLGSGKITSSAPGIDCGTDCDQSYTGTPTVTLTATADPGSTFMGWELDGTGSGTRTVPMTADRSVRAIFSLNTTITTISDFTPGGLQTYLNNNTHVNTPARFVAALPQKFRQNWLLMSRSESLQTGTAEYPRLMLVSADAKQVFTIGLAEHASFPGSHPNAIEYMQWDAPTNNFRFHEIILDSIPAMGAFGSRSRTVSVDDSKCSKCHSTGNVLNNSTFPGTTGVTPGTIPFKYKPNWDSYDSWAGLLPQNRDRIYEGSVEAAAIRRFFNLWTWRSEDSIRAIIEQLEMQPPGVASTNTITRHVGGPNDGEIEFAFDGTSFPVSSEPQIDNMLPTVKSNYSFDALAGTGTGTDVYRGGNYVRLQHPDTPTSVEGRAVQLFDFLGGFDGQLNPKRIADELVTHRFATGSVPIDIRPIALAITNGLLTIDSGTNTVKTTTGLPALSISLTFFDDRNGMNVTTLETDTEDRAFSMPRRKADFQKFNLDRTGDMYLNSPAASGENQNGLIQEYGANTYEGTVTDMERLRQEIFRRPNDDGYPDRTVMGGIYVDREDDVPNIRKMTLYRYFLEPLGVQVSKWSMGVRGRSRTYSFADVFSKYEQEIGAVLEADLVSNPVLDSSGVALDPLLGPDLIEAVNITLASLPASNAVPRYTDVQRIFNKSCIECHGGLDYPPYSNFGTFLDLSEDESPPTGDDRLQRSYDRATFYTNGTLSSTLYQRIIDTSEACPNGMMPCGGPALSKTDIETIKRWILGSTPYTHGDPHLKTIEGIRYDFQADGEFTLLRGQGVELQARQTAIETDYPLGPNAYTGLTTCVSLNTAVAVRIGQDRITYQPNLNGIPDPTGMQLRINGQLVVLGNQNIPLLSGGRIVPTLAPGGLQIEMPGGSVIVVTPGWWNHYQVWYLNIDARRMRTPEGLMGAIPPGSWLPSLPDGTPMGPKPVSLFDRYDQLYDVLGDAWRVTPQTSLFDYAPGTDTYTYSLYYWPGGESPEICEVQDDPHPTHDITPLVPIPFADAQIHCGDIIDDDKRENCIKDVMVTGEVEFSMTYLLADFIGRNNPPTQPILVHPENFQPGMVDQVLFHWIAATDEDGDDVTHSLLVWAEGDIPDINNAVPITNQQGMDMFTEVMGLDLGRAYYWKVIAEDGKGGTTESEIRRFERY